MEIAADLMMASYTREQVEFDGTNVFHSKPRLLIDDHKPGVTIAKLRDIPAVSGILHERGGVVRLVHDSVEGGTLAQVVTPDGRRSNSTYAKKIFRA
jgi:hypothetical protein